MSEYSQEIEIKMKKTILNLMEMNEKLLNEVERKNKTITTLEKEIEALNEKVEKLGKLL